MKHPTTHDRAHPTWGHRWNPYATRDYIGHLLDRTTFNLLLQSKGPKCIGHISPNLFAGGCLDAPEEIPLGATACVRTVGGYDREEYRSIGREWDSWQQHERAVAGTAEMLKAILKECEQ